MSYQVLCKVLLVGLVVLVLVSKTRIVQTITIWCRI